MTSTVMEKTEDAFILIETGVEKLMVDAHERGRRAGLEEAIDIIESCVEQPQTPVREIRSRLEPKP